MTAVYNEADGNASGDSRISLQQIAGALTELEPFGTGWWRGDCPLCHEVEAGPAAGSSFMVFPNGGNGEEAFKCERCDESGYVDDFLRLRFSQAPAPGKTKTDMGNAERLVARHGGNLRYCHPWRKWLDFDGTRWLPDDRGAVREKAKETVRSIYDEAGTSADEGERKALASHALRSEARQRVDAMISLAESSLPVRPDELDANPWLLNCKNGTVELRTGELLEHNRENLITKLAPAEYDPEANAAVFEAFLKRILPSEALRRFLQRAVGYAASGEVSEEMLPILHGVGANGKSTLVNAIMEALGDYAVQAAPELLLAKRGSHPTELTDLFGARFVACMETDDGRRLAEGLVKQLTGRDKIRARKMREDFWEFDPTHTAFLATNHRPEVRGTDHAIWRRLKLVPFEVTIPDAEQDKKLPEKLRKELPGILAWIARGCLEYQREGLGELEEVTEATAGYRSEMDVLAAFIEDRCVVHPDAHVGATPLYEAYKDWCGEAGENQLKQTKFGLSLRERGFEKRKAQLVTWHGIGLRIDSPNPDSDGDDKGTDEAPNRLNVDGSVSNCLNAESRIGKGDTEDSTEEARRSRPKNNINGLEKPREAVNQENGLNYLNHLNCLPEDDRAGGGSAVSQVDLNDIRRVFGQRHYYKEFNEAFNAYLRDRNSEEKWEQLCRAVCIAARLDVGRWLDYSGAILGEVGRGVRS